MAKRKQKLKVYSTPIGFHDALVAAPSQKAALEAWGAGTNLFSQGSAHLVTDPKLAKVPLQHPGQVLKIARGTHAEQLAALGKQKPPKRTTAAEAEIVPAKRKKRAPRPTRAALDRAQSMLARLEERQAGEMEELEKQQKALDRKTSALRRAHERDRDKARQKLDDERERYEDAIRDYESG